MESGENVKTLVLTFPDVVGVIEANGYASIALNPFCDNPVSVSAAMIDGITKLDGYKRMVQGDNI